MYKQVESRLYLSSYILTLKMPRKPSSTNVVFMSSAEYSCKRFRPIFAYTQTVWTLIRLLLGEQSDLGPHCLQKWLLKSEADDKADDNCCDWQFKGKTLLLTCAATFASFATQKRSVKILIRLPECAGWSESSLCTYVRMYVFWRRCSGNLKWCPYIDLLMSVDARVFPTSRHVVGQIFSLKCNANIFCPAKMS